ncbi:F-box only protein 11-like [Ursus arctos]|uniref:F-box only protein 11-like n=1 Tax=Ursus arctos TaxID=9644 RepID=UPI002548535B|nr:F-box only protein 11-like [Ursus arctos]
MAGQRPRRAGRAGGWRPGLPRAQLAEEASTEPPPPPPKEEPLRLEPPAPPQPRAETDPSADLRLLILTAGNKQIGQPSASSVL